MGIYEGELERLHNLINKMEAGNMSKDNAKITACVDATIEAVGNKIQKDKLDEKYPETVKSFAMLLIARAFFSQA